MRRGLVLLLVLGGAVALTGCFGEKSSPIDVTSYLEVHETGPGRTVRVPLFLESTYSFKQDLGLRVELPQGWTYRAPVDAVTIAGYRGMLLVLDVSVPGDASPGLRTVTVFVGDTRSEVSVQVRDAQVPVEAGRAYNLTWMHLAPNGTVLALHETALKDRGSLHVLDDAVHAPFQVHLAGPAENGTEPAPPGFLRVTPDTEAALLQARVGEALVLRGGPPGDPLGTPTGSETLVLRVVGTVEETDATE